MLARAIWGMGGNVPAETEIEVPVSERAVHGKCGSNPPFPARFNKHKGEIKWQQNGTILIQQP
jgi:hypothetical protein